MQSTKKKYYNPGDIIEIPFPFLGEKDEKSRSAVIISNSEFNRNFPVVICVKVTTKTKNHSCEIELFGQERQLCGLPDDSWIDTAVIFSLPKNKITGFYGSLTRNKLNRLLGTFKQYLAV